MGFCPMTLYYCVQFNIIFFIPYKISFINTRIGRFCNNLHRNMGLNTLTLNVIKLQRILVDKVAAQFYAVNKDVPIKLH